MQKIILLPKMTLKEHFFVSRLVVFNDAFALVKEDSDFVASNDSPFDGDESSDIDVIGR